LAVSTHGFFAAGTAGARLHHFHIDPDGALVITVFNDDVPGALERHLELDGLDIEVFARCFVRFAGLVFVEIEGVEEFDIGFDREVYLDGILGLYLTFIMKIVHDTPFYKRHYPP
jgi:hypothetical protein